MPNPSKFDPMVVRDRLGADRLQSYLEDCDNDLDRALDLYAWNAQIAAAFLEDLGRLEVVLRNRFDHALTEYAISADHPTPIDTNCLMFSPAPAIVMVLDPGTVPALANGRGYAVLVAGRLLGQPQTDAANDGVNNMVGTMTPEEVAAATAIPIGACGRKFYGADAVTEAMNSAGFSGLPVYVGGRGGVLGDVAADVVVSAFALFHPAMIEMGWNQTKEQGSPADAATALAAGIGGWATDTFVHLDGLDDFAAATRAVIDSTAPMSQALYAGWRAIPVPDDPATASGLALQVLREMRFGFHVNALSAMGMTPVEALIAQANPQQAQFFGWTEPFPDSESLQDIHRRAEDITSARMAEVYEAVDATQRVHIAATVSAIAEIVLT